MPYNISKLILSFIFSYCVRYAPKVGKCIEVCILQNSSGGSTAYSSCFIQMRHTNFSNQEKEECDADSAEYTSRPLLGRQLDKESVGRVY